MSLALNLRSPDVRGAIDHTARRAGSPAGGPSRNAWSVGVTCAALLGVACSSAAPSPDSGAPAMEGGVPGRCSPGLPEYVIGPLQADPAASDYPTGVGFIDIDRDGDLDVLRRYGGSVTVLLNDGAGAVTPQSPVAGGDGWPLDMLVYDLDEDGDDDVIANYGPGCTSRCSQGVQTLRNDDGVLVSWTSLAGHHIGPRIEVDADANLEFLARAGNEIAEPDGAGGWTFRASAVPAVDGVLLAPDFQSDGLFDLVLTNGVLFQGPGGWTTPPGGSFPIAWDAWHSAEPLPATVGDWDRDGRLDLAAREGPTLVHVLRAQADGSFASETLTSNGAPALDSADVDCDGDIDLVFYDGEIHAHLNDGTGGFAARVRLTESFDGGSIRMADLNGDELPDFVGYSGSGFRTILSRPHPCADTSDDELNCGTCGVRCPAGATCAAGACECPVGETVCDGRCEDTRTDGLHCGACGTACEGSTTCQAGTCACPSPTTSCGPGGRCEDLSTSLSSCGACDNVCPGGPWSCIGGACACDSGATMCGTRCVHLLGDFENCGACGSSCSLNEWCESGVCICPPFSGAVCSGVCVLIGSDLANCGTCGNVCPPTATYCENGVCTP